MPGRDGSLKLQAGTYNGMIVRETNLIDSREEGRPTIVVTLEQKDAPHDYIDHYIYTNGGAMKVALDVMRQSYGIDLTTQPISTLANGGEVSGILGKLFEPVVIADEKYIKESTGEEKTSTKVKRVGAWVMQGLIDNEKARSLDDAFLKAATAKPGVRKPAPKRAATVQGGTPAPVSSEADPY